MKDGQIIQLALSLLNTACEENKSSGSELQQGIEGEKNHALNVLECSERLLPTPSVALRVAALLHDIDRVVNPGMGGGFKGSRKSKEYLEHKKKHAKRSADYVCPKLLGQGVEQKIIERIEFLILHHDDIGPELEKINDSELNVLATADTFAFFTSVAPKLYKAEGEERLKDKIRFLVGKIPASARNLLRKQKLDNKLFDKLKNEVISEFTH